MMMDLCSPKLWIQSAEKIQLKLFTFDYKFVQVSSKLTEIKCQYRCLASLVRHKANKLIQHNLVSDWTHAHPRAFLEF